MAKLGCLVEIRFQSFEELRPYGTMQIQRKLRERRERDRTRRLYLFYIILSFLHFPSLLLPAFSVGIKTHAKQTKQTRTKSSTTPAAWRCFSRVFYVVLDLLHLYEISFFPHGWAKFCTRHWHEISATAVQPNLASAAMGAS